MHNLKRQTIFKITTLLLALALMVPSVVKFSHIFSHHKHEICNGELQTHLHKADLDCNFYKFKLSTPFTIPIIKFEFLQVEDNHQLHAGTYAFLNDCQQLHFLLRGPPQIDFI